jgi:hypothetical protein
MKVLTGIPPTFATKALKLKHVARKNLTMKLIMISTKCRICNWFIVVLLYLSADGFN